MPFRRLSDLSPGIDLPDHTMAQLRDQVDMAALGLTGSVRIIVFGCDSGPELAKVRSSTVGTVPLTCVGQLPPAFIDYVISRDLADGVMLTGCRENSCNARFGIEWTNQRLARERDPHLRNRVPRERIRMAWVGPSGTSALQVALSAFANELQNAPVMANPAPPADFSPAPREPVDA